VTSRPFRTFPRLVPAVVVAAALAAPAPAPAAPAPETLPIAEIAFRAILSKEETVEYLAIPADSAAQRVEWRRRYWRRIDPDPTTMQNEREAEHDARVAEACSLFAPGGAADWDDRCVTLVRYGEPLVRVVDPGEVRGRYGLDPPRERWLYPACFFYMEDRDLDHRFEFGISPIVSNIGRLDNVGEEDAFFKEGRELEAPVNRLTDFSEHPEVEQYFTDLSQEKLVRMLNDGREAWNKVPNTYQPAKTGKEIAFFFDVTTFRAPGGEADVVVNYLIPIEALTRDDDGVWLERRTIFLDRDLHLAGSEFEAIEKPAEGDVRGRWILNSTTIRVPPGTYDVASRVTDLVSEDRPFGLLRTQTTVPDYGRPTLLMSDILFGTAIGPDSGAAASGGVRRRGMRVVPQPVRRFGPTEAPCLYFEIYNLTPGEDGRHLATIEYALTRQEKKGFFAALFSGSGKGRLTPGVATSVSRDEAEPDFAQWITIDTKDLPPDTYSIEARVVDAVSGVEASRKETFVVAAPPG
jgi:GWxTD domain-containing protein